MSDTTPSRFSELPSVDITPPRKKAKVTVREIVIEAMVYIHQKGEKKNQKTGRGGITWAMPKTANSQMEAAVMPVDLTKDFM